MRTPSEPATDRSFVLDVLMRAFPADGMSLAFPAVVDRLPSTARALVFGGVLRNAVLAAVLGRPSEIRDVDYVVFGLPTDDALHEAFADCQLRRTTFGGLKLAIDGLTVDIWRAELEQTIAGQPPRATDPERFLHCVTLTTDAILFDPRVPTIYEQGFLRAVGHRVIDLGRDSRWIAPWIPFHLAHLAYVRYRTGFALSPAVCARLREVVSPAVIEPAIRYLETKNLPVDPREVLQGLIADADA